MATSNRLRSQGNGVTAYLFFIVLVMGIAAIIFLKMLGAHQFVVTVVPVGIMLAYAFTIHTIRKLRLRLDQAGDNLYYLGFLYTLTSLAYSLFEFGSNGIDTTSIITNFGIAIWTTITGLALRVLFSQLRTDPIETENLARVELADASRHLKSELDVAARDIAMFHRSLEQMTTEAFQGLHETLDETMLGSLTRFEGSIELFASTVAEANKGLDNRSEALRESSDKLVNNISDLAFRIDEVKVSDDILVRQLQPAIDKIDGSAQQLSYSIGNLSQKIGSISIPEDIFINQLQPAIDKIDGSAQQLGYSMGNLSQEISGVSIPEDIFVSQLQPAIDKISEAAEMAKHNADVDTVRAQSWAELSVKVAAVMNGIHGSLKGAQDTSALFVDGAKSVQSAAEHMSSLSEHMEGIDLKLESIMGSTDKDIKRVVETVITNLDGLSHQLANQAKRIETSAQDRQHTAVQPRQSASSQPQQSAPSQPQQIAPSIMTEQPPVVESKPRGFLSRFGVKSNSEH
jgi:hypothetical protein